MSIKYGAYVLVERDERGALSLLGKVRLRPDKSNVALDRSHIELMVQM